MASTINCNSVELAAEVGKLYIWPSASVRRVVDPGHVLWLRLTKPLGHWARSIMCDPTFVEPEPQPAARSGTGMIPAITHASGASLMLWGSSDC